MLENAQESAIKYEELTRIQKLAYFLMTLGAEASSGIIKHFDEEDVEAIGREMTSIKMLDVNTQRKLVAEFSEIIKNSSEIILGGANYAQKTLELSQGESKATTILDKILKNSSNTKWAKELESIDNRQIFSLIQEEQPQTIAFIISGINVEKASAILKMFPLSKKEEIIIKMGNMSPVPMSRVQPIVNTIRSLAKGQKKLSVDKMGGFDMAATIINSLDKQTQDSLIENLDKKDAVLSKEIQKRMFTFEDLVRLDTKDLQKIIRDVDTTDMVLAMKSASQKLKDVIYKSMSKRAAETLKEEIELMGPVRLKAIEEAKDKIIAIVRKLEQEGAITISTDDEDDQLIS